MSAGERRDEVIAAAAIEFANGGYAGTSTGAIALRAGVSQPYLFQLFGTKQDLFLAAVRDCFARTARHLGETAAAGRTSGLDPIGLLELMGDAYIQLLLADRDLLRLQLHAYAACSDPEVRAVVRDEFHAVWRMVADVSGAGPQALQAWFANGMLINVIACIGNPRTLEEFYALVPGGIAHGR
jgi:AcrR family transcriptional regulator